MDKHAVVYLVAIPFLGVAAQWLAWRLRLPAILLLLLCGLTAGPFTGWLQPEALLGELLAPLISLSVAVILFEGGLSLALADLRQVGVVVRRLLTVGLLFTWLSSMAAAYVLLAFPLPLAALLGAMLAVTGPTVIGPLLRHVRPTDRVASILRWEGIVIDPLGATLAILVFEALLAQGGVQAATTAVAWALLLTLLVGAAVGLLGAVAAVSLLRLYRTPDFLQNPVVLMLVIGSFTAANELQEEAGLLAVTVMGVILANQPQVAVKHISEFKESLSILLVSSLFILLGARLQVSDLTRIGIPSLGFLLALVLVVRPCSVALAAWRSDLGWRERLFLAWMAPRGIVAASVSSIFALRLAQGGYPGAERLAPVTFMVIIGTVAIYSLSAAPLARRLGIAKPTPQGVLLVGAHRWARAIAKALRQAGHQALLVDTDLDHIEAARREGLPAYYGSMLEEGAAENMDLSGIGRMLALTDNDEVNALMVARCSEFFERTGVYQLCPDLKGESVDAPPRHWRGRLLFGPGLTYKVLDARFAAGAVIGAVTLTETFDYAAFLARYGKTCAPLFVSDESGELTIFTTDAPPTPGHGQTVLGVFDPANVGDRRVEGGSGVVLAR